MIAFAEPAGALTVEVPGLDVARGVYRAARRRYARAERVPVVEWIEREYVVTADAGAAEPGPYRFAGVPWWREVVEAFADEVTEEVVVKKSSQVGYTELLMAYIAWTMAQDPSSTLMIQPTVEMAEAWSKERLEPVFRDVPAIGNLLRSRAAGMARTSDDTLRWKGYPGGYLAIIGANSPSGLASRPIRRVLADELDRWKESAGKEGSPLSLAAKRSITFWNRKKIAGGTPVDEGASATDDLWEASDQRHWVMPCPHCGHVQPFRWRDETGAYHLVYERDAAGEILPESVGYRCADCAAVIEERHKAAMVAAGRWQATHPGRRTRGYHVWAAYSPWMTWERLLREFDAARGAEALLKVFVNTLLGLTFSPAAEKIDPGKLHARADVPDGVVPDEVGLLTAGVDVQGDRLEYVIVGWGDRECAVVLRYGQVEGDPGDEDTWAALGEQLAAPWTRADGGPIGVEAVCGDTGFRPETVWKWRRRLLATPKARRPRFRVYPTVGRDGRGKMLITAPGAVTRKAQRRPWVVGTDTAKDSLAARLNSKPGAPQSVRFSQTLPVEYYEHLTAEELRTEYVGGRPVRRWKLRDGRRNEGLDCTLLALAALHALGPATVAALGTYAQKRAAAAAARTSAAEGLDDDPAAPAPSAPPPPRARGGFVRGSAGGGAGRAGGRGGGGWVGGWRG